LGNPYQYVRTQHESDQFLVYERASLLFVFNWNPTKSFEDYPIFVRTCKKANVILSTDDK